MLGKQRPLPLLSCQQAWAGFQAGEAVSQVGCDCTDWSCFLPDKPQPSGQGTCFPWGVWSCALLRPSPYYPPSPSTFYVFCNLLKGGGYWLPVRPWINSHPLSFTHFVSTQQAGVSLVIRYFPFPPKFTVLNSLLPQQGEVGASVPHSTYISAGLGTGNGGGGAGDRPLLLWVGDSWTPQVGRSLAQFLSSLVSKSCGCDFRAFLVLGPGHF